MPEDAPSPVDRELLARAELALTQLNTSHGLSTEQSATLTAIRLRLEGKARASLEDLLDAGRDLGGVDAFDQALSAERPKRSFDDLVAEAERAPKPSLDDLVTGRRPKKPFPGQG